MNLEKQVEINKEIMGLIRSKYPSGFPLAYNTPESRYYERLERDIAKVVQYEIVESSRAQSK